MVRETTIEPFRVAVPDEQLRDLRERLARTRWPDSLGEPWEYGTDESYLRELVAYWRNGFDWHATEARLNSFPQFRARLASGLKIHYLHVRGNGPAPVPLIISHGWPGSVLEMLDIIPRLADPQRYGGEATDAFDVIVPSLPGYGFSDRPAKPGMHPGAIADLWAELMSLLGYERFGAQGGDWGSAVSTELAIRHPLRMTGVHLNYVMRSILEQVAQFEPKLTDEAYFRATAGWLRSEGGYSHIQGTKPQTLAYGLNDSPAGLAGWIVEKFRTWSDCDGDVERAFSKDDLLGNISVYWHTQTIASSTRLYRERESAPPRLPDGKRLETPFGYAAFPKELSVPSQALLERAFRLERYTEMPRGGHFAAWEQPDLLADDIRAFFRPLR